MPLRFHTWTLGKVIGKFGRDQIEEVKERREGGRGRELMWEDLDRLDTVEMGCESLLAYFCFLLLFWAQVPVMPEQEPLSLASTLNSTQSTNSILKPRASKSSPFLGPGKYLEANSEG
jgi:hypothetical protein